MTEGKLDHFADLSHLLAAASDIIIANLVEVVLLLVSLDRVALAVDDGILGDDAILGRVDLNDLELDLPHATSDDEEVALADWPVGLTEVGGEEDVEERAGNTLDGVGNGQNGDSLGLLGVSVMSLLT